MMPGIECRFYPHRFSGSFRRNAGGSCLKAAWVPVITAIRCDVSVFLRTPVAMSRGCRPLARCADGVRALVLARQICLAMRELADLRISKRSLNSTTVIERHATPGESTNREPGDLLRDAVATLPPEQHAAIELAFLNGLPQAEAADQLDQPIGTIKACIRRGLITMRDILEEPL